MNANEIAIDRHLDEADQLFADLLPEFEDGGSGICPACGEHAIRISHKTNGMSYYIHEETRCDSPYPHILHIRGCDVQREEAQND